MSLALVEILILFVLGILFTDFDKWYLFLFVLQEFLLISIFTKRFGVYRYMDNIVARVKFIVLIS